MQNIVASGLLASQRAALRSTAVAPADHEQVIIAVPGGKPFREHHGRDGLVPGEQTGRVARDDPGAVAVGRCVVAMTRPSISRDMEVSLILVDMGVAPLPPGEPREPGTAANAGRLARTARDAFRALLQVRGSPAGSLRPGQTVPFVAGGQGVAGSNPAVPTGQIAI